jgi:predicted nucleic acid-binding Zn ribbon protein
LKKSLACDYANLLGETFEQVWPALFDEADVFRLSHRKRRSNEASQNPTDAPFKCSSAIVGEKGDEQSNKKMSEISLFKVCQSCGNDISGQKGDSKFCSEKYAGKTAKKCRNKNSNERRNKKHTIMKAKSQGAYIAVSYLYMDELYTDVLHSSEIETSDNWIDKVVSISIFKDEPMTLEDSGARTYLRSLLAEAKSRTRGNEPVSDCRL